MTGIERFRRKKLLTQAQLASLLDVTPTSVSYWEAGKSTPRVELLRQMAQLLGTTMEDLLRTDWPENDLAQPSAEPAYTQEGSTCNPAPF